MHHAKRLWGYALEIFFPPLCIRCRTYLSGEKDRENLLCSACFSRIPTYKTVSYSPNFSLAAVSSYENESLRELLHAFKYDRFTAVEVPLRKIVSEYLKTVDIKNVITADALVVPIPLHKKRLRQRGFNQSEYIARILGDMLSLSIESGALTRTKDTPHQTTQKTKKERVESLRGSFAVINDEKVKNKTVILVDDVYTTGATMTEASKTLRRGGAKEVIGFVVAKTN
jgi:ComF family protein